MNDSNNATPLEGPTCGGCVHCLPGPNTQNDIMSRNCYRFPPVPMMVGTNKGPAVIAVRAEIRVETPACGEYEEPDSEGTASGPVIAS